MRLKRKTPKMEALRDKMLDYIRTRLRGESVTLSDFGLTEDDFKKLKKYEDETRKWEPTSDIPGFR